MREKECCLWLIKALTPMALQFFTTATWTSHLDGKHVAFGKVIKACVCFVQQSMWTRKEETCLSKKSLLWIVGSFLRELMMGCVTSSKMVMFILIGPLILIQNQRTFLGGSRLWTLLRPLGTNSSRSKTIRWPLESIARLCSTWIYAGSRKK